MFRESSPMTSASEARFRIQTPAPTARVVKVISLDPATDGLVGRLAEGRWSGATFLAAAAVGDRARDMIEEVAAADLVVMVTAAGADAKAATIVGEACSLTRVVTTTIVVRGASATDEALSMTLAQVRPWSLMVAVASDEDYVEDILRSFR